MEFRTKAEELDIKEVVNSEFINWDFFKNSVILITGGTGLIGSHIIKSILYANETYETNIKIIALVRNKKKAESIFNCPKELKLIVQNIEEPVKYRGKVDYIIHAASNTSSESFVKYPVETLDTILHGTKNILEFARKKKVKSLVYISSMEVYGVCDFESEEPLQESDYGYIDILNPRSSYPEGKRTAETMCAAYAKEYNLPVKTARLVQTIGGNTDSNDKRVFAQFARSVAEKKDIVLHTEGKTIRSYCYITDAITGIFTILERGTNGEAYNISNKNTTCSIKEMAEILAEKYHVSVKYEKTDNNCYLPPTKLNIDSKKLEDLNWRAKYGIEEMYSRIMDGFKTKKESVNKEPFIQKIFSVKNDKTKKIITILGYHIVLDMTKDFEKYKNLPVNKNKIVLSSTKGKRGYNCNPKYIAEEIIRQKLPYELVWLVNKNDKNINYKEFPKQIKLVEFRSKQALKELATAKIWIDNQAKRYHVKHGLEKKPEQVYIQTWHGAMGIKKIGDVSGIYMYDRATLQKEASLVDYLTSNSALETGIYKMRFWNHGKILEIGHPRNDIFFHNTTGIREKVYNTFGISNDVKTILYAPTFRNFQKGNPYTLDYLRIIEEFEKIYKCRIILLTRLHHEMKHLDIPASDNIIDVTRYGDMQELMLAVDFMISDYSGGMFDFMLSEKPCFIYATDIEEYSKTQGFVFPLESTPFPIGENNDEFIKNLREFDYESYKVKVRQFLKERHCYETGQASKKVVELIKEICG